MLRSTLHETTSCGKQKTYKLNFLKLLTQGVPQIMANKKQLTTTEILFLIKWKWLVVFQTSLISGHSTNLKSFVKSTLCSSLSKMSISVVTHSYKVKWGVITLIQKEDSSLLDLTNWRPIIPLNVDCKIATKAIAKRLDASLPKLSNHDQRGFIKDVTWVKISDL